MLRPKQKEILRFIKDFALTHNVMPTYEEIGRGVGLTSKSSVFNHMMHLTEQGYISRDWGDKRYTVKGIKYIEEGDIKPPS